MHDPAGDPISITVRSTAGVALVDAPMAAAQVAGGATWSPGGDRAEWLMSFPKPGAASVLHSIVAGHVTWKGQPGTFHGLVQAKQGDEVIFAYPSGEVVFKVTRVAFINKERAVSDPEFDWIWNGSTGEPPTRTVSLFTCDPNAAHVDGHSVDNVVVQAIRTR